MKQRQQFQFGIKKEDNSQEVEFKISETMVLKDLPSSISSQFIEVYKLIKENRNFMDKNKNQEVEKKEKDMYNSMEKIKMDCFNDLYLAITSLGRQIDNGRKILKDFQMELNESKNDEMNVSSSKTFPSPFLVRYSKKLEDDAESISEGIEAYKSHLQSLSDYSNDMFSSQEKRKNDVLFNFFYEENEAILRSSSKISQLSEKLSLTRTLLCQKLKIDQSHLIVETESANDSIFQSIKSKYKQFQDNKKSKIQRNLEDSDLFGVPVKMLQSNIATPLLSGGGYGSFISSRQKNNPDFTPPKSINTKNTKTSNNVDSFPVYNVPATPASKNAHYSPFS